MPPLLLYQVAFAMESNLPTLDLHRCVSQEMPYGPRPS